MLREFEAFAKTPTASNFLSARAALLSQSPRPLTAEDLSHLEALLAAGDPASVSKAIDDLPPIAVLSPAVHLVAAEAAEAAGDDADCQLERFLLITCLEAILHTGNGTEQSPYVATCTMDERHVCEMLGLVPRSQSLVNRRGKALDAIECEDGACIWFDVSGLVSLPAAGSRHKRKMSHGYVRYRNTVQCLVPRGKRVSQTQR